MNNEQLAGWVDARYEASMGAVTQLQGRTRNLRGDVRSASGRDQLGSSSRKRLSKALREIEHGLRSPDRKHYKRTVSGIDKLDHAIRKMSQTERESNIGKQLIEHRSRLARGIFVGTNRTHQLRGVIEGNRSAAVDEGLKERFDGMGVDNHPKDPGKHVDGPTVPPEQVASFDQMLNWFDYTRYATKSRKTHLGYKDTASKASRYVYGLRGGRTLATAPLRLARHVTGKGKRILFRPLLKGNIPSRSGDLVMGPDGSRLNIGIVRYGSPTTQTSADNIKGDPVFRAHVESLPDGDIHLHVDNQKSEDSIRRDYGGVVASAKNFLNDTILGEAKKEADRARAARRMADGINRECGVIKMLSPKIPADSDLYKGNPRARLPENHEGARSDFVKALVKGEDGFDIDDATKGLLAHSLDVPGSANITAGSVTVDGVEKPIFATEATMDFVNNHRAAINATLTEHYTGLLTDMGKALGLQQNTGFSPQQVWGYNVLARGLIELDMAHRTRPSTMGTVCKEMCDRGALNMAVMVLLSGLASYKELPDVIAEVEVLLHGSALDVHQREINGNYQDVAQLLSFIKGCDNQGDGGIGSFREQLRVMELFQSLAPETAGFTEDNTGVPGEGQQRTYSDDYGNAALPRNEYKPFVPLGGEEGAV